MGTRSVQDVSQRPVGAVFAIATSGSVANAVATATIPAIAGKRFHVEGYEVSGTGSTALTTVVATLTGLAVTKTEYVTSVLGAVAKNADIARQYPSGLVGVVNTAIVLSCPALGSGNLRNCSTIWGYYL